MTVKDWDPKSTYVLVLGLGLEQWADPEDPHWKRHAELRDFFLESDVPAEQVLFWEDKEGHPHRMRKHLPTFLADTTEDSMFFFYYAGHGNHEEGDEFYFCHPDTEDWVSGPELFSMIEENFWGSQAVLLADCCYSGELCRLARESEAELAFGALTSATGDIESTGTWTFTDTLLGGLRGDAGIDADGDGVIRFDELATRVLHEMKTIEEQPADFGVSASFDPRFGLAASRSTAPRKKK